MLALLDLLPYCICPRISVSISIKLLAGILIGVAMYLIGVAMYLQIRAGILTISSFPHNSNLGQCYYSIVFILVSQISSPASPFINLSLIFLIQLLWYHGMQIRFGVRQAKLWLSESGTSHLTWLSFPSGQGNKTKSCNITETSMRKHIEQITQCLLYNIWSFYLPNCPCPFFVLTVSWYFFKKPHLSQSLFLWLKCVELMIWNKRPGCHLNEHYPCDFC